MRGMCDIILYCYHRRKSVRLRKRWRRKQRSCKQQEQLHQKAKEVVHTCQGLEGLVAEDVTQVYQWLMTFLSWIPLHPSRHIQLGRFHYTCVANTLLTAGQESFFCPGVTLPPYFIGHFQNLFNTYKKWFYYF